MNDKNPKPKPTPKLKFGIRTDRYGLKPTLKKPPWEDAPNEKEDRS